jgi:hypothetical protein
MTRHLEALLAQLGRAGQARRPGADAGHALFALLRAGAAATSRRRRKGLHGKALQAANLNRLLVRFPCITQEPSQSTSTGQTRAQLAPSTLASRIVFADPITLPEAIFLMKRGTSMCVGHAPMHGASKQLRQRFASTTAARASKRRMQVGKSLRDFRICDQSDIVPSSKRTDGYNLTRSPYISGLRSR